MPMKRCEGRAAVLVMPMCRKSAAVGMRFREIPQLQLIVPHLPARLRRDEVEVRDDLPE
jgi:hypothetical protein